MSSTTNRAPLWYCYECHAEMRPLMIPDAHCASCNSTFLEMLEEGARDDPRSFQQQGDDDDQAEAFGNLLFGANSPFSLLSGGGLPRMGGQGMGMGGQGGNSGGSGGAPRSGIRFELRTPGRTFTFGSGLGSGGATASSSVNPGNVRMSFPEFVHQRRSSTSAPTSPTAGEDEIETPFGPVPAGAAGAMDMRHLLMQYLLSTILGGGNAFGPFDGEDMPMHGRMGDYVFTQDGLDRIVTQLMEAAAQQYQPKPAPPEMIETLPKVKLTFDSDLVKSGNSCAICTDYFAPLEKDGTPSTLSSSEQSKSSEPTFSEDGMGNAITLPCKHAFHEECIVTWLKTSGTCPVCRYQLVPQPDPHGNNGGTSSTSSTGGGPPTTSSNGPGPLNNASSSSSTEESSGFSAFSSTPAPPGINIPIDSIMTSLHRQHSLETTRRSRTEGRDSQASTSRAQDQPERHSPERPERSEPESHSPHEQANRFYQNFGPPTQLLDSIFRGFGSSSSSSSNNPSTPSASTSGHGIAFQESTQNPPSTSSAPGGQQGQQQAQQQRATSPSRSRFHLWGSRRREETDGGDHRRGASGGGSSSNRQLPRNDDVD